MKNITVLKKSLSRYIFLAFILLIAATLPLWGETYWMHEFVNISCFFIFAMMWNLLAGFGGMVSVGQQAYFGIGGYVMLILCNHYSVNPFLAIPISALFAALLAYPISKIAFRLKGGYFAIGTWVIAEVLRLSVSNIALVGGGSGTSLTAFRGFDRALRQNLTYWVALLGVVLVIFLVYGFLKSKQGLALQAIRDNEIAASSQGIHVERMKLAVYLVAALGCAAAGALYFVSNLRISPDAAFNVNWTAYAIFIVMIGGIGRIEGPIMGALIFWALNHYFSDYGTWYLIGLGCLAVGMTLFVKDGVSGRLHQHLKIDIMPVKRTFSK